MNETIIKRRGRPRKTDQQQNDVLPLKKEPLTTEEISNSRKLPNCPHCNSKAELYNWGKNTYVKCSGCQMRGPVFLTEESRSTENALESWGKLCGVGVE